MKKQKRKVSWRFLLILVMSLLFKTENLVAAQLDNEISNSLGNSTMILSENNCLPVGEDNGKNEIDDNVNINSEELTDDTNFSVENKEGIIASGEGWTLDEKGHLEVHYSYTETGNIIPWSQQYAEQIKSASLYLENYVSLSNLFFYCKNLESVDFHNSDFSNVERANGLFWGCTSLKEIKGLYLPNVKDVGGMFAECESLSIIDIDMIPSTNITNMAKLFDNCSSLKEVKNLDKLNTSQVESTESMFSGVELIETLEIQNLDMSQVKDMSYMFAGCSNLKKMDLTNWDVSNVENMQGTFLGCNYVASFNIHNWNTSHVTNMAAMFLATGEGSLDLSFLRTGNVSNMRCMFMLSKLEEINLDSFDTHNVEDMTFMFFGCEKLRKVDLKNFYTPKLKNCYQMFYSCIKIQEINLSHFDFSQIDTQIRYMDGKATEMGTMVMGTYQLKQLFLPANVPMEIGLKEDCGIWYDENDLFVEKTYVNCDRPMVYHATTWEEYYAAEREKNANEQDKDFQNKLDVTKKESAWSEDQSKTDEITQTGKKAVTNEERNKIKQKITVKNKKIIIKKRTLKHKRNYKIPLIFNEGKMHTIPKYSVIAYPKNGKKYVKVLSKGNVIFSKKAKRGKYQIRIELPENSKFYGTDKIVTIYVR